MRYQADHKEQARARLVGAAGRGFRKRGYGGIGVDGLAKEAGVTSGAFYGHFASKEAAFAEAVVAGLEGVQQTVAKLQSERPADWAVAFIDTYLGVMRTCDLAESCAIQSLSAEVARAGESMRALYEQEMRKVVQIIADGLSGADDAARTARAWALLSTLSGAVTLSRALNDDALAEQVAVAARTAALAIIEAPAG